MQSLQGRSLLTLKDFTKEEIVYLLDFADALKKKKQNGIKGDLLLGKNIILLFEKTSTRTRCAFEVACFDEGGHATFLTNSQMGKKESLADTARVLGRFYDGIEFRGFCQETAEALARYSGVPVWNGLTDQFHPTQALADVMTIREHVKKPLGDIKLVYVGDARNNVANSLMVICAKLGMRYTAVAPQALLPDAKLTEEMRAVAETTGGVIETTSCVETGVKDADVLYTDVWVSMGEGDMFAERIALLKDYQVNRKMMEKTNNPDVIFLHCLPSFHDTETQIGKEVHERFGLKEMEVTNEVFESEASKVFDQAENRMHTIKAVLCATLQK